MCIFILSRTRPDPDYERFRCAFMKALADTGSDTHNRKSEIIDAPGDGFHFVVWGQESLDCHVYHVPLLVSRYEVPSHARSHPAASVLECSYCSTLIIEGSPDAAPSSSARVRRVAFAVAELLDHSSIAIFDWFTLRLSLVTPETAARLRSPNPDEAFSDSITLQPLP